MLSSTGRLLCLSASFTWAVPSHGIVAVPVSAPEQLPRGCPSPGGGLGGPAWLCRTVAWRGVAWRGVAWAGGTRCCRGDLRSGLLRHTGHSPVGGSAQRVAGVGRHVDPAARGALPPLPRVAPPPVVSHGEEMRLGDTLSLADVTQLVNGAVMGSVCLVKPQTKCGPEPHRGLTH